VPSAHWNSVTMRNASGSRPTLVSALGRLAGVQGNGGLRRGRGTRRAQDAGAWEGGSESNNEYYQGDEAARGTR
jgi:hypothetical protein